MDHTGGDTYTITPDGGTAQAPVNGPDLMLPAGEFTVVVNTVGGGVSTPVPFTLGTPNPPTVIDIVNPNVEGMLGCFTIDNYDPVLTYALTDATNNVLPVPGAKVPNLPIGTYDLTAGNTAGTSNPTTVDIVDARPPPPTLTDFVHPVSMGDTGSVTVVNPIPTDTYTVTPTDGGTPLTFDGPLITVPAGSYTVVTNSLDGGISSPVPFTIGRPAAPEVINLVHPAGPGTVGCFTIDKYDTTLIYKLKNNATLDVSTINTGPKVFSPIGSYAITAENDAGPSAPTMVIILDNRPDLPVLVDVMHPTPPNPLG